MEEKEIAIINLTRDINNLFLELEQTHSSDLMQINQSLHQIQDVIASRVVRRDYPIFFVTNK